MTFGGQNILCIFSGVKIPQPPGSTPPVILYNAEDVLSSNVAHYWSPDSRYICYAELNDTDVPLQAWPRYGHKSDVYGDTIQIAYPKVGRSVFFSISVYIFLVLPLVL